MRAILACDERYGIGQGNSLPWPHDKEDMKWFRGHTLNEIVVMGRNTWESLPSKPLEKRIQVVLTSNPPDEKYESTTFVSNVDVLFSHLKEFQASKKIWVMGGASIYVQLLPYCTHLYLTRMKGDWNCDTFIPFDYIERFEKVTYRQNQFEIRERIV